jgi:glycosyltransferase involved in cell wall biosynthesis
VWQTILVVDAGLPRLKGLYDGGGIWLTQLLEFLVPRVPAVDLLFFGQSPSLNVKVRNLWCVPLGDVTRTRFDFWLNSEDRRAEAIRSLVGDYDAIFVCHMSNLFGADRIVRSGARPMIVGFPLCLGESYRACGEQVPSGYILREKQCLARANLLITPSSVEHRQLIETYGVAPARIKVIPRWYDPTLFSYVPRTLASPLELVFVGSHRRCKNTRALLPVIQELLRRRIECCLHLIGPYNARGIPDTDSYTREFLDDVAAKQIDRHVVLHGAVLYQDIPKILERCHIGITLTRWETFGRTIIEGMATGLPMIVPADVPCFTESLQNGQGVFMVSRGEEDICNTVIRITSSAMVYGSQSLSAAAAVSKFRANEVCPRLERELGLTASR